MSIMHNADRTRTHDRRGSWLVMQSMQPLFGGVCMTDRPYYEQIRMHMTEIVIRLDRINRILDKECESNGKSE